MGPNGSDKSNLADALHWVLGEQSYSLEQLAEHTQFIVITHNRQTLEAADTIYGISMDENGVSQVISLQLDEMAAAVGA